MNSGCHCLLSGLNSSVSTSKRSGGSYSIQGGPIFLTSFLLLY